jgi:primase-polymerase (primpol)-like protein
MEKSDMEMSLDEDDDDEIKTTIAREVSNRNMQYYQMKLSTYKSNMTGKLLKVVKIMFSKELGMEIELHDLMNEDFEAKTICSIDELPETDEETSAYFHQYMTTRARMEPQLCSD